MVASTTSYTCRNDTTRANHHLPPPLTNMRFSRQQGQDARPTSRSFVSVSVILFLFLLSFSIWQYFRLTDALLQSFSFSIVAVTSLSSNTTTSSDFSATVPNKASPNHQSISPTATIIKTSQHAPRRNNSRNLCHAIPYASPKATRMPFILSSNAINNRNQLQCHRNAILYMVQKGKHSSYKRNSTALFLKSLDLLYQNYLSIGHHVDNVDVLIFHSGDYTMDDLRFIDQRYNHTVHFKLIDLNNTDYWVVPTFVQHDNISQWGAYPEFRVGYRHMIRWYALRLYDFVRDYAELKSSSDGCSYKYLMRMDEDSFLHSPIAYDLFDFMQANNYSYAFRMCAYEMEMDVWEDYVDHVNYCGVSLPQGIPFRPHMSNDLCGFYNNFFIVDVSFMLQPDVQHFLQWTDATGIMYRERYNDLQIQTIAVYAFLPPQRIHRFLDWTYEHMTYAQSEFGLSCPHWGSIQAGYLDPNVESTFLRFEIESKMNRRKCPAIRKRKVFRESDMSPTYSHLPPTSWFNDTFGMPRHEFEWKTFAAGSVEGPDKGILSG